MMIALAILAITTAMAAPRMSVIMRQQRVNRTSQIVASDIRAAFTSAARGRVPVRVSFTFASRRYAITNRVTGDTIIQRNLSSGDLNVSALAGSVTSLDIFPSGIATSSDTIAIGDAATYLRRVAVSRVGAVRVLP
jgi:Tfp pilus assembly protein FimT